MASVPGSAREACAAGGQAQPRSLSDVLPDGAAQRGALLPGRSVRPLGIEVPAAGPLRRYRHAGRPACGLLPRDAGGVRLGEDAGLEPAGSTAGDVLVFAHSDPYQMLSAPRPAAGARRRGDRRLLPRDGGRAAAVRRRGRRRRRAARALRLRLSRLRPSAVQPGPGHPPAASCASAAPSAASRPLDRLIELTLAEMGIRRFGGESIRLRLSELIFVEVLRRHLAALPPRPSGVAVRAARARRSGGRWR